MNVPKREFWNNADPERLPDVWRLTKVKGEQTLTAVCQVWAVELGWDLRVFIDGALISRRSAAPVSRWWIGPSIGEPPSRSRTGRDDWHAPREKLGRFP